MTLLSEFHFDLPAHLIAQRPPAKRTDSRLLVFKKGMQEVKHDQFKNLADYLNPGDALVLNNTKVIPARFFGQKTTGGKVEILLSRVQPDGSWIALIASKRKLQLGSSIQIGNSNVTATILAKIDEEPGAYQVRFSENILEHAEQLGQIPLPPYITRICDEEDKSRYQTVFADACHNQAVAAPTAGLHFDTDLLAQIEKKGVRIIYVTLHVGPGTFLPMRTENVSEHKMHAEPWSLSAQAAADLCEVKKKGGRVIAVGTTSVRVLETAAMESSALQESSGLTRLFIRPGFRFQVVDSIITNFHLPRTTLLLLVAAFIGKDRLKIAYEEAIKQNYRFFSYGDACLFDVMDIDK